jgi:hypothetical protein
MEYSLSQEERISPNEIRGVGENVWPFGTYLCLSFRPLAFSEQPHNSFTTYPIVPCTVFFAMIQRMPMEVVLQASGFSSFVSLNSLS